jgi:Tol biopolymer transport system component
VSNVRRITFDDGCQEFPSLTPDGQTLVYDATVGSDSYIFSRPLEGGVALPLAKVHGWDYAASVSPDGRQVAFLREAGGVAGTFIVPIEGGKPRRLSAGSARPSWSRDGASVWAGTGETLQRYDSVNGRLLETVVVPAGYLGLHARD